MTTGKIVNVPKMALHDYISSGVPHGTTPGSTNLGSITSINADQFEDVPVLNPVAVIDTETTYVQHLLLL